MGSFNSLSLDGDPIFKKAIDKYCWGSFDDKTVEMIKNPGVKYYG